MSVWVVFSLFSFSELPKGEKRALRWVSYGLAVGPCPVSPTSSPGWAPRDSMASGIRLQFPWDFTWWGWAETPLWGSFFTLTWFSPMIPFLSLSCSPMPVILALHKSFLYIPIILTSLPMSKWLTCYLVLQSKCECHEVPQAWSIPCSIPNA
jgi:hypothetical protein